MVSKIAQGRKLLRIERHQNVAVRGRKVGDVLLHTHLVEQPHDEMPDVGGREPQCQGPMGPGKHGEEKHRKKMDTQKGPPRLWG